MDIHQAIEARRSIRNYLDKPLEEDKLNKLLISAQLAPSARNTQPYKLVVVREKVSLQALSQAAANQAFVGRASAVIAAVALDPSYVMRCGIPSHIIDIAIALDHVTLAAVEEGLGTCWIGAFYQDKVKQVLGIPESCQVVALLAVGYQAKAPEPRMRKPISELVCFERFEH